LIEAKPQIIPIVFIEVFMNTMRIRKIGAVIFAAMLVGGICSCISLSSQSLGYRYLPGIYEGTARGFRGPVRAAVQVDENGIAGIELSHEEDEETGGAAMEELLELILEGNSTEDLDAVTGATESSLAFLAAVDDALAKARLTEQSGEKQEQ
jgi:fumarate reductase flavoprotein subunit